MKTKHNEGFSLIEVLVSIVVLAAITIPCCSSLVLSYRMNQKADEMLKAQLAVSSAVESLMATGLTESFHSTLEQIDEDTYSSPSYPGLVFEIELDDNLSCYEVKIYDEEENAVVTTTIRNTNMEIGGGGGE